MKPFVFVTATSFTYRATHVVGEILYGGELTAEIRIQFSQNHSQKASDALAKLNKIKLGTFTLNTLDDEALAWIDEEKLYDFKKTIRVTCKPSAESFELNSMDELYTMILNFPSKIKAAVHEILPDVYGAPLKFKLIPLDIFLRDFGINMNMHLINCDLVSRFDQLNLDSPLSGFMDINSNVSAQPQPQDMISLETDLRTEEIHFEWVNDLKEMFQQIWDDSKMPENFTTKFASAVNKSDWFRNKLKICGALIEWNESGSFFEKDWNMDTVKAALQALRFSTRCLGCHHSGKVGSSKKTTWSCIKCGTEIVHKKCIDKLPNVECYQDLKKKGKKGFICQHCHEMN
jgi:ribosomal protein S27E